MQPASVFLLHQFFFQPENQLFKKIFIESYLCKRHHKLDNNKYYGFKKSEIMLYIHVFAF